MDSNRASQEMETLWKLAGRRTPLEHAAELGTARFPELRPRIHEIMMEMILMELEQEPPVVPPSVGDISVLLGSEDARVRLLGVRLLSSASK
jgi:hypothetical protein